MRTPGRFLRFCWTVNLERGTDLPGEMLFQSFKFTSSDNIQVLGTPKTYVQSKSISNLRRYRLDLCCEESLSRRGSNDIAKLVFVWMSTHFNLKKKRRNEHKFVIATPLTTYFYVNMYLFEGCPHWLAYYFLSNSTNV
jgi:hypothetical protein